MTVEQVYQVANDLTKEYLGETAVLEADLHNVVDVGTATISGVQQMDRYVNSLIDHIGKVVFVNRAYSGKTPSLMVDGWEYGAILEKVTYDSLPEAEENDSWKLVDGQSYDPNIFTQPKVSAKFFSKKTTFDIPMSFAERQVKSAFDSATQLNAFFSMIYNAIDRAMTMRMDQLASSALNNMIALTIDSGNANQAVNLLTMYNAAFSQTLTAVQAITDPDFIRYASYIMGLYQERLQRLSKIFNIGKKDRFTPSSELHVILLSEFAAAAKAYLQSDTYHDQYVALVNHDTVPYWQGSGTDYAFTSTSKINVKANDGTTSGGKAVEQSGILGVMFDRYAVGVANLDQRVTTNYNARAEFYNNWYKFDAGYFNDSNENFVVFYVA